MLRKAVVADADAHADADATPSSGAYAGAAHQILSPASAVRQTPTCLAALEAIECVRPSAYARTRNHLDGAVTGLSAYITHGVVTLHDVLAGVLERGALPVQHKLVYELGWREYFRHVWLHDGEGILCSIRPGPMPEDAYATRLPDDIRTAHTGIPVIDQAVRTLYSTGTLHNHARMWLASYVVHIRHVHWRAGADWLVAHLLDGDLASNHLSWQWVAGTGSHKPYLFNAENVARHAPAHWHSAGTVVDQPYDVLDRVARGDSKPPPADRAWAAKQVDGRPADLTAEPVLHRAPPADLNLQTPDADANIGTARQLAGRTVWLVHPWALRPPPPELRSDAVVIGVYPREYHDSWPWSEARWRWVDRAMSELASQRWWVDAAGLARALADAKSVRSVDDPHLPQALGNVVRFDPVPALFPSVERRCASFSQWWTRATRGLQQASELL
jgi:deoxyribodipyrimidine photo-lyase